MRSRLRTPDATPQHSAQRAYMRASRAATTAIERLARETVPARRAVLLRTLAIHQAALAGLHTTAWGVDVHAGVDVAASLGVGTRLLRALAAAEEARSEGGALRSDIERLAEDLDLAAGVDELAAFAQADELGEQLAALDALYEHLEPLVGTAGVEVVEIVRSAYEHNLVNHSSR